MYKSESPYILHVDTNSYAGNFERKMCAYVTGVVGGCEVGEEAAKIFVEELGEDKQDEISMIIDNVSDDSGCYRPCGIAQDSQDMYNAVAIYFTEKPSKDLLDLMVSRIKSFPKYQKKHGDKAVKII